VYLFFVLRCLIISRLSLGRQDLESKGVFEDIVRATTIISQFPRPASWPVTPPAVDEAAGVGEGGGADGRAARLQHWVTFADRKWDDIVPAEQQGRESLLRVLEAYYPNAFCTVDLIYAGWSCLQGRIAADSAKAAASIPPFGSNIIVSEAASANAFAVAPPQPPSD
jgi:hypothetical protein